ncbi:MAG: hypothetical protein ACK4FJ_06235 [Ferrovibrio sp.]|uniref:hypothetical protein n=1 Tax=Ferrovibrio sp. TaxID=1917215 RepID=UPI00391DD15D
MPIGDYVGPADGGCPAEIVKAAGGAEHAGGLCLMLCIVWMVNCSLSTAKAPGIVWGAMRDNIKSKTGPRYLRQFIQQQAGPTRFFAAGDWFQPASDLVELASRRQRRACRLAPEDGFATAGDMATRIQQALRASSAWPPTTLVIFAGKAGGSHATAVIARGGKTFLLDPLQGVLVIDPARLQALDGATAELFAFYKIRKGLVIPLA